VDYIAVRTAAGLQPPVAGDGELVVLGAARLGRTRLIDNVALTVR
jgi:pantoate--beta-alanine ligase